MPYFSRREATNPACLQTVSAIIDSMAENLPDFKRSSIFYYPFLDFPGAVAARAINTLDSVIGFKDPKHISTGWFSTTLETLTDCARATTFQLGYPLCT